MNAPPLYPRRKNLDGSYDSICLTCFLTASHAATEAELDMQDRQHICGTSVFVLREMAKANSQSQS